MKPQNIILIGVAHNYNIKWLIKCDYIIALTNHMEQHLLTTSFNKNNIAVIPNMILIKNNFTVKYYHKTIVIGTMARFVKKKGLHLFLNAIAILKSQKRNIRVIIGGDGPEKEHLINMAINLNLTKIISFIGFAHDKDKFFRDIDIFCLPSMHEPFGITVLEAMEHSTPIIATKTEGPSEILRDGQDGILCETNSCQDLIAKMVDLMNNQSKAQAYAASAYLRLQENYSLNKVSIILSEFIQKIST
jgi:glycosyltransferase involved in cell wall biosynthesis